MNTLKFICAVFLLLLSPAVFASEHFGEALGHAKAAAVQGELGDTDKLIGHAKEALELVLEASLVTKGVTKNHLDDAAKELQEAIELANLGHIGSATIHTEAAVKHIQTSNQYRHPAVIDKIP